MEEAHLGTKYEGDSGFGKTYPVLEQLSEDIRRDLERDDAGAAR